MRNDSNELEILSKLLDLQSPRNHTVPCELIRCSSTTLAFMPSLRVLGDYNIPCGSIRSLLDVVTQMAEALEFMHDHKIAFSDFAELNIVLATDNIPVDFPPFNIVKGRCYLIDFGSARSFSKGPGQGLLTGDFYSYPGHFVPPEGTDAVDPYAYDVYSLGKMIDHCCGYAVWKPTFHPPKSLRHIVAMLMSPNPSLRPTMRRTVKITRALQSWILSTTLLYKFLPMRVA
ncbi:hypothetical protein OBBRIDRAFT_789568 [Obba rivulosa]|uniref:Protein kinase domain-containing protein n=1 Tax=Obba rivulosa TaxID=1052685 RepID=A0A8E2DR38_9APHY|nr:hypothetical protein OBBRIDRAFT_789568 [Obba rivulosa]